MQLKKLSPLAGLLLTALLSACGGGGDEEPPPPAAPPPPGIVVSNVTLSSTTPRVIAETPLQFDGGVCSGGTGTLTASWNYDDGTALDISDTEPHSHRYDDTAAGARTVTVTCTDTAGTTAAIAKLNITVLSAAMNGFLGRTWSAYSRIDPVTLSAYPVAGIADTAIGDISGVWIRRNAGIMEVAAGTATLSTNWAVSGTLPTQSDQLVFNDALSGGRTAVIDQAVSPDGHVMAAWKAGSSIWYAHKSSISGTWSTPEQFNDSPLDRSIKVVVNNDGNGAIAYCKDVTVDPAPPLLPLVNRDYRAYAIPYLLGTRGSPKEISNKCDIEDKDAIGTSLQQRTRAFDIAIDKNSKIFAAGFKVATVDASKSAVLLQITTTLPVTGWASEPLFADEIITSPDSLSLSLSISPDGNSAAIAWNQTHINPAPLVNKSNVHASVYRNGAWSAPAPVQNDFITKDYTRPLVAVNDNGVVFLAMRLKDTYQNYKTEVSNYKAAATPPTWSSPYRASEYAFHAADVAIDKWGTGLLTSADSYNTQAGTFSKLGIWSGFKAISPRYPYGNLGSTFHYQSMRALPDGRAILVTSVYDDQTALNSSEAPIPSGYMLLK